MEYNSRILENKLNMGVQYINDLEITSSSMAMIFFVLSGRCRVVHNGSLIELNKGDIYIVNAFDLVRVIEIEKNQVLITSILLKDRFELNRPLSPFYMQEAYGKISHVLSALFIELESQKKGYEEIVEGYLLRLQGFLKRYLDQKNGNNKKTHISEKTQDIVNYINNNYQKSLTLEDLSSLFYINKYYLSHSFKEQLGMTIGNYMKQIRLSHAHVLLQQTDHTITSIAFETGFPNVRSFSSSFKKKYGLTPKSYRKNILQKPIENIDNNKQIDYNALKLLNDYAGEDGIEKFDDTNTKKMFISVNSKETKKVLPLKRLFGRFDYSFFDQTLEVLKSIKSIKYVSINKILLYVNINKSNDNIFFDSRKLMGVLRKIVNNGLIPYLQISFTDYELFLKEKLSLTNFYIFFAQLSNDIQREFINTTEWIIEFRCFYELQNKGKVCEPVKCIIDYFLWLENVLIHLPVQPDKLSINNSSNVFVIDDMAKIIPYSIEDILSILSKPIYTQIIAENKNIKAQNHIAKRMDYLECDSYYKQFTELIYANQMLWLFLDGISRKDMTFEPVSIDGTPLFTYFPKEVSEKLSLVNENGVRKAMWYAYEFRNSLYNEIVFHNEYLLVTKRGSNYRMLSIYPEKEVINTIFSTTMIKDQEPQTNFHILFTDMFGEYQLIEKKITPDIQKKYIDHWKGIDSKKLSSEIRTYIENMSQPEINIMQKNIDGTLEIDIFLPIFGISYIEINKI